MNSTTVKPSNWSVLLEDALDEKGSKYYHKPYVDPSDWSQFALDKTQLLIEILGNAAFIILLVFRTRMNATNRNEYHVLIFNQLFWLSNAILFLNNTIRIMKLFASLDRIALKFVSVVLLTIVMSVYFVFMKCIQPLFISLNFIVAVQRIVITHASEHRYLVTGKWLKFYIFLAWGIATHQCYIDMAICTLGSVPIQTEWTDDDSNCLGYFLHQLFLFFISMASNSIYIHIYRLVRKLSKVDELNFIYQFAPLSVVQSILATINVLSFFFPYWSFGDRRKFWLAMKFPFTLLFYSIPLVISLSYIASRENLKFLMRTTIEPFIERTSEENPAVQ